MKSLFYAVAALGCSVISSNTYAVIDGDAPVVQLRTSCTEAGIALNNCFDTTASLVNWMTTVRAPKPSSTAPLTVKMGAGTFDPLILTCDAASGFTGNVTFTGTGRDQSRFLGVGSLVTHPMVIRNCTALGFADLKVQSPNYGYIDWAGGGTSSWENVDVVGQSRGWFETSCGTSAGKHYWFNSRISSSGFGTNTPYVAACDESWFFGSEIVTNAYGPLVWATGSGQAHIYGSNLRVDDSVGALTTDIVAAKAGSGGMIHIHGTGIDVTGNGGHAIKVLVATSGGMIHANETSYNLSTGTSGTIMRVDNSGGAGHIHAPYVWETHPDVPFAGSGAIFSSQTGYDTAVVTSTADGHPHMVIYDSTCSSKWFDTITNACR